MAGPVPVAMVLGGNPVSHRSCVVLVRVGLRPVREYEGEIFTDYYFGEANTANKLDNQHNNAINENLNWGGFPGCYKHSLTRFPPPWRSEHCRVTPVHPCREDQSIRIAVSMV